MPVPRAPALAALLCLALVLAAAPASADELIPPSCENGNPAQVGVLCWSETFGHTCLLFRPNDMGGYTCTWVE